MTRNLRDWLFPDVPKGHVCDAEQVPDEDMPNCHDKFIHGDCGCNAFNYKRVDRAGISRGPWRTAT